MTGESEEDKDQDETMDHPPPVPPQRNDRTDRRYNLCNTRGRDYDHRYARKDYIIDSMAMTTHGMCEVLEMPQMSLKAGLRAFGNDSIRAVEKEMCQLHDRGVMMPVHKKNLTSEQQKEALAYLMFLKRKCCGKVKGWMCRWSETESIHRQGRINSTHGQYRSSVSNGCDQRFRKLGSCGP